MAAVAAAAAEASATTTTAQIDMTSPLGVMLLEKGLSEQQIAADN